MKTTITLTFLILLTSCSLFQPTTRRGLLEQCVKDLIDKEVPAAKATDACERIYKNPQLRQKPLASG